MWALRKSGEANLVLPKVEGSVGVLHKTVAEEPDVAAETEVLTSESTNAFVRLLRRRSEVEAVMNDQRCGWDTQGGDTLCRTDGPVLSTPVKGNFRDRRARELIETLRGIKYARAGDCRVELLDGRRGAIDNRGTRVNPEDIGFGKRISSRNVDTNIVSKPLTIVLPPTLTLAPVICQKPTDRMMRNVRTD
jgi:hypothetical protein